MTGRPPQEEPPSTGVLVLVRHGESEWNRLNRFTGWKDVGLTEEGLFEAHRAGAMLEAANLRFDAAFTSTLQRATHTLQIILDEIDQEDIPTVKDAALNERDYGELMGINKDEARRRWGAEQVHLWQRSYTAIRSARLSCGSIGCRLRMSRGSSSAPAIP
jgi:2,3-bisphosphoglycerate-dependent phosphoglycerate mutase